MLSYILDKPIYCISNCTLRQIIKNNNLFFLSSYYRKIISFIITFSNLHNLKYRKYLRDIIKGKLIPSLFSILTVFSRAIIDIHPISPDLPLISALRIRHRHQLPQLHVTIALIPIFIDRRIILRIIILNQCRQAQRKRTGLL